MTTRGTFPDAHFHNMTADGVVTISNNIVSTPLYVNGTLTVSQHGTGAAGITDTLSTRAKFDINTIQIGMEFITTIFIDLTGLNSGDADGDIIGLADTADCQLLTFSNETHGQIYKIEMICVEVPAGGDTDIDLKYGDSGTSTEEAGPSNPVSLVTAGGDWITIANAVVTGFASAAATAGRFVTGFNNGAALDGKLLFLTQGAAGSQTNNTYSSGKFIIKLWGYNSDFRA